MFNIQEAEIMAEVVAREKGISKESVLTFLEEGMQVAMRKLFPEGALIQVEIDTNSRTIAGWRLFKLVNSITEVEAEMLFSEVENEEVLDGYVWEPIELKLTRQQLGIVKQVALQKIKNESKITQIEDLLSKPNKIFTGTIKFQRKESIIAEFMGLDITIPRKNIIPGETYKVGNKISFTLEQDDHGVYVGSRTSNEFIAEILRKEVVQVEDGQIEIVKIARVPGFKTKILVRGKSQKVDPVKSCVGHRGIHIKNMQLYLSGEHIDVLEYDPDPASLLIKALRPLQVLKIAIEEESGTIEAAVEDDAVGYAIGRNGKNTEVISKLIGLEVKIFSESQWEKRHTLERNSNIKIFMVMLNCDEELAAYIVDAGISEIEELAYVPEDELAQELVDLDQITITSLKENAKEVLGDPIKVQKVKNLYGLYALALSEEEINCFLTSGINSVEDVADLSTDEFMEINTAVDVERVRHIIMEARKFMNIN